MPIYEFQCKKCKSVLEVERSINFEPKEIVRFCETCCVYSDFTKIISVSGFKVNGYNEKNNYSKPSSTRK